MDLAAAAGTQSLGTATGSGGFQNFPGLNLGSNERGFQPRDGLPPQLRQQFGLDRQMGGSQTGAPAQASADPLDVIRNTPGYNFQLEQGTRALNANRSAGGSSGGELLKDFSRFNQGVASSFYQDYANRLQDIATGGNAAASSSANRAITSGANIGNSLQNAGNARASGIVGTTNSITNLITELAGGLGQGSFGAPSGGLCNLGGSGDGVLPNYFKNPSWLDPQLSDIRLKKNVKLIDRKNDINWYTWEWNDTATELGVDDPTFGVIAQEVQNTHPDAISEGDDGYLKVDYRKLV